jgi:hypothetical protein
MAAAIPIITAAAPYISAGSSILGAFGAIRQGKQQAAMYKLQGQQAQLKASRDQLQYEQQANQTMGRLLQTNAAAAARGFASGVSGFSGSAKLVQERNEFVAGKDIGVLQESGKAAKSFGDIQASMFREAADQAVTSSYFDAIGKIGSAAFSFSKTGIGEKALSSSAENVASPIQFGMQSNKYGVQLPRY